MTSKQLLNLSGRIKDATDPGARLNLFIASVVESSEVLQPILRDIYDATSGSAQDSQARGLLKQAMANAGIAFRSVNLWDIFSDVKEAQSKIESFVTSTEAPLEFDTEQTVRNLSSFAKQLEQYWRNHSWKDIFPLLDTALRLKSEINTLRICAETILANLAPESLSKRNDEDTLSIYLPEVRGLESFGRKLSAVAELYTEYCELFEISTARFPLTIVKVESGSLWADVLGNGVVTHLIEVAIVGAAGYFYRNFVSEGRRREIPKDVEAIQVLLQLEKSLAERNIDVTAMRERIAKAAVKVAENLNTLLGGEVAVEVNGTVHPMTPDAQQRLLNGGTILMLSDSTQTSIGSTEQDNDPEATLLPEPS